MISIEHLTVEFGGNPLFDDISFLVNARDRIALVQGGAFLEVDTPQGIVARYPSTLLAVRSGKMHRLLGDLHGYPYVNTSFSFGTAFHVTLAAEGSPEALKAYLVQRGHPDVEVQVIPPSVEDCFMLLSK